MLVPKRLADSSEGRHCSRVARPRRFDCWQVECIIIPLALHHESSPTPRHVDVISSQTKCLVVSSQELVLFKVCRSRFATSVKVQHSTTILQLLPHFFSTYFIIATWTTISKTILGGNVPLSRQYTHEMWIRFVKCPQNPLVSKVTMTRWNVEGRNKIPKLLESLYIDN